MKNKYRHAPLLLILAGIQIVLLMEIRNLKSGFRENMAIAVILVCLGFLITLAYSISPSWLLHLLPTKKNPAPEKKPETSHSSERPAAGVKYVDPRASAEALLKNTSLKHSVRDFGDKFLSNLSSEFEIMQGIFYLRAKEKKAFRPVSFYAIVDPENVLPFTPGQSLNGEAVKNQVLTELRNIPDEYRKIESGLGSSKPTFVYMLPLFHENSCLALIEFATVKELSENRKNALSHLIGMGGKKLDQFIQKSRETQ